MHSLSHSTVGWRWQKPFQFFFSQPKEEKHFLEQAETDLSFAAAVAGYVPVNIHLGIYKLY